MNHDNADSLAEYFADIITSRHNQHAQVRFVGAAGTGKSWAALNLAIEVSKIVAEIKGGCPEDYYNFNRSLAVMGQDEIRRVMTNPPQYGIIHCDDVGAGLNARRYMTDYNIEINNILTTFRPNHNLVLMTMQAGFQVDKIARVLGHYQIIMEQQLFDKGVSIAKVHKIKLDHLSGKIMFPFININGTRYVRHVFHKPPDDIAEMYEIERAKQLKILNETQKKDELQNEKKITQQQICEPYILECLEKGMSNQTRIAEEVTKRTEKFGIICLQPVVSNVVRQLKGRRKLCV